MELSEGFIISSVYIYDRERRKQKFTKFILIKLSSNNYTVEEKFLEVVYKPPLNIPKYVEQRRKRSRVISLSLLERSVA